MYGGQKRQMNQNIDLWNIFCCFLFCFVCLLQISAVRLPREPSNPERLKGFGYAEFEDLDSLFNALSLNEEVKKIRVESLKGGSWQI